MFPVDDEWEDVFAPEMAPDAFFDFDENSGPIDPPAADARPIAYFLVFCTVGLIEMFVTETNRFV